MSDISVNGNKCVISDAFKKRAHDTIIKAVRKSPFKQFPIAHTKFAKEIAKSFFETNASGSHIPAICQTIIKPKKNQTTTELVKKLNEARAGKLSRSTAESDGYIEVNVKPIYTCPKAATWKKGTKYYNSPMKCSKVKKILQKQIGATVIPVTMYAANTTPKELISTFRATKNYKYLFNGNKVHIKGAHLMAPFKCKGPNGEKAIYHFPNKSRMWDTKFIVGTGKFNFKGSVIDHWRNLRECTFNYNGHKITRKETKFLFNFGVRLALGIDASVDGVQQQITASIEFAVAMPDSSYIRGEFLRKVRPAFIKGIWRKMYLAKILAHTQKKDKHASARKVP